MELVSLLPVPPQMRRKERVRLALTQVPEPLVEALLLRRPARTRRTETPFPDQPGCVPRRIEPARQSERLRRQCELPLGLHLDVVAHEGVPRVQPRQEHAARRRAHRRARVELREAQAFTREPIQIRRDDLLLPVAAELPVPEVVGHDQDDVGLRLLADEERHEREDREHFPTL